MSKRRRKRSSTIASIWLPWPISRIDEAAKVLDSFPEVGGIEIIDQGQTIKVFRKEGDEDTNASHSRFRGLSAIKVTLKREFDDGSFIPERLIASGFRLKMFAEEEIDLEDVFLRITEGKTN